MFFNALIQVSACVADIIRIAQITLKMVYNALYFYSTEYFIYSFVKRFVLLLTSLLYFSFHYVSFVTLSTYFHIFITSHILTRDFTSYMQSFIHFIFKLENYLSEIETSWNFFASFDLKMCLKKLLIKIQEIKKVNNENKRIMMKNKNK